MKTLLTWVILLLPVLNYGQCPDFTYYVNGSSLNCNPDELELCVTIPDGAMPSGPCLWDYVIRVSYPSINFNYTDLTLAGGISLNGGWYDRTPQGSTTTILEWEIAPISTHMHGCFKGISFGTLPTFTVELFNTADPGIILSTQTFNFTTTPTISTDMTISEAIGFGYLLDPAISPFTKQDVYIDATLTADIDYDFGAPWGLQSELTMAPGSQIIVDSQVTLGINNTKLTTCDDAKWEGILIQDGGTVQAFNFSEINNAVVGVELLDGANLEFGKLLFNKCTYGIGSFGTAPKNINISYSSSPFFFSTVLECETGIRLENCNTLNLLNNIGFFDNETGISALNTNLNISDISLYTTTLNAIEAEGSTNVNLENSVIYTSGNGIELDNVFNTYIDNLIILDCTNGIVIYENAAPTSFEIRNSDLRLNYWSDISAEILPGSIGIVFNNNFGQGYDNSAYYNILLEGIGFGSANHLWSINDNDGMNAKTNNVTFRAINRGSIFKNDQAISGPPFIGIFTKSSNFVVSGGERNIINNNDNLVAAGLNIIVSSSQMSQVSCNDNISAKNSMQFYNDNAGTEVWGNDMNSQGYNYIYGSTWNTYAVTAIQENHLNLFDPSSEGSHKARHYGTSASEVNLSQHLIHGWNVNQGDAEYPFFTAVADDWFDTGADDSAPFCPPTLIIEDKFEDLAEAITTGSDIIDNNIASDYNESTNFESTFKLYRNLIELEALQPLDQSQLAMKSILSNHISAEYAEYEREYTQFINELNELSSGIKDDVTQLNLLYNEITKLDLIESGTHSFSVDASQKEQNSINQNLISDLESGIRDQKIILDTYRNNSITELLSKVGSLTNSDIQAAKNRKDIYSIILEVMQFGKASLSSDQLATLESISTQCLGIGGEPVLWARGLTGSKSDADELPELIDECLVKEEADPRSNKTNSQILISPNPTMGVVNIDLSAASKNTIIVKLYDQLGRDVFTEKVNPGTKSMTLDLSHLPSGMYILSSDSELIPASKILLSK